MLFLFDKKIRKLIYDNKSPLLEWIGVNVFLPLLIVVITLLLILFRNGFDISKEFDQTLFNGALPLIAINVVVFGFLLVLNHNKHKENELNLNFAHLRFKLFLCLIIIFLLAVIVYVTQALFAPFGARYNYNTQIILSILLIIGSTYVSSIFYVMQEDNLQASYGLGIGEEEA